jgi:hypothetical protein
MIALIRLACLGLLLGAALPSETALAADLRSQVPANPFAYIPPQCWTKTWDATGPIHNPCYTCHVAAPEPNYVRDEDLQLSYDFADGAARNPWTNLFVDRRPAMARITDADILAYVRTDNIMPATAHST